MNENNVNLEQKSRIARKIKLEIAIIIILMICLCITTVALALSQVTTRNTFQTDAIDIILNNGQKIIRDENQGISPGKSIISTFPLKNNSDHEIYYRLYFTNIRGNSDLADLLLVTIKRIDTNETLYDGVMSDFLRYNVEAAPSSLHAGEEIMLEAIFFLPEEAKNKLQNQGVTFDMVAEAVQAENNDEIDFGDVAEQLDPDDYTTAPEVTDTEPEVTDVATDEVTDTEPETSDDTTVPSSAEPDYAVTA